MSVLWSAWSVLLVVIAYSVVDDLITWEARSGAPVARPDYPERTE